MSNLFVGLSMPTDLVAIASNRALLHFILWNWEKKRRQRERGKGMKGERLMGSRKVSRIFQIIRHNSEGNLISFQNRPDDSERSSFF